ncbi:MAG: UbiA family prenyltransferase [Planctomycetota bacterium]|nr:UbiA family prenyltransferase [Planctomycetota bacterium]
MYEPQNEVSPQTELDALQWGSLKDWMQLVRLPAVFTLFSNVLAATVLIAGDFGTWSAVVPTALASLAAYWAGMVLNDVVDLEEDRRHRSKRPLAAGRISPVIAGHVGTALLMICPILILGVTVFHTSQPLWQGAAFAASVALSICVRAYNSGLKPTLFGPLLMGSCRALNILMVGCTVLCVSEQAEMPQPLLYFAAAIGVYILGVTVLAGKEELENSDSAALLLGLVLQVVGLGLIAFLTRWETRGIAWPASPNGAFPLLLGLISMTVMHRCLKAIIEPKSSRVQLAVKHSLLTLILIDASVVVMWAGPVYGCIVVALLIPALSSALRVRTT